MLEPKESFATVSKRKRQFHDVFYLPSVQVHVRKFPDLASGGPLQLESIAYRLVKECFPYLLSRAAGQGSVIQREVNSGLESWVECFDTIRG
jgi:hypothetical protein